MSDRYFEIRGESGHSTNYIPSGRQLPRTPPLADVKRHLDFCNDDPSEDCENMEAGTRAQDDNNPDRTFDFKTSEPKTEPDDHSMLKGMKGYQLTPGDLEFIQKMQEEKLIKKLQRDLEEVQRLLKKEMMAIELVYASKEKAQAELKKLPSCEELTEWVKVVLNTTSPLVELTDLDTKSLLAMVTKEDIQKVMEEKKIELARMEKMVTNKKKKEAKEREQLEKQIASEQLKIQGLMSQLCDLKSELAQQEEAHKLLEMQINEQEAAEIKVEAEKVDISEEIQATESQVKSRGKGRKKVVKFTEKLQDTASHSKSTRSKHTDSKTDNHITVTDSHADKKTSQTLKTKAKTGAAAEKLTKSVKAARGPSMKVQENESNPQESDQAVRGQRKAAGTAQTTASHSKNQHKVKSGEAPSSSRQKAAVAAAEEAGEDTQNASLRRSKRIASRR